MNHKSNFNPNEWAKTENAPQKSAVTNQAPVANKGDWAETDTYQQVREVVDRVTQAGADLTDDYNDWFYVGSALASELGEAGRDFFHELSRMSGKYNATECDKKYDDCLRNSHNQITIATFFQKAKDAGIDIRTTRPETPSFAPIAESHRHSEKCKNSNSLIINNDENSENTEGGCESANFANEEVDLNFHSYFSEKIDESDWCPFLRTVVNAMDTPEGKDKMALITITMLSGVTPNYYSIYGNKAIYPPLYMIFYGPAGSLKGEIADTTHLLTPLKLEVQGEYAMAMNQYELEHAQWEAKGNKKERSERGPEPQKPEFRIPLIPGDSSASKVIRHLKANGMMGAVLFESEAKVISNTLSADYGKQWSSILLKAAHHETVSHTRVEDDRFIEIEEPRLAVGLTCTPGLLPKLFPSFEDGLGSRFLYLGLKRKKGWRNPFLQSEKILADVFKELGKDFLVLYHEMGKLGNRRIQFLFTQEQQDQFNAYFAPLTDEQTAMLGDGSESFIYRLGLQGTRIAMMLTLLRRFGEWDRKEPLFSAHEQAIQCSEKDFELMIKMVDTLVNHTATIYASLAREEDLNPFKHNVNMHSSERRLYDALPYDFDTKIIEQTVRELGMKPQTAKRYISDFVNKHHVATRVTTGHYQKINLKK